MSLSASMWTSVSGLLAHGEKMNVVGNQIANVSTIGFKGQRMDFNDYLYMSGGSASGPTQIGAGVGINAVLGDYSQGLLNQPIPPRIWPLDGNGFFGVRKPGSDQKYYTRARGLLLQSKPRAAKSSGPACAGLGSGKQEKDHLQHRLHRRGRQKLNRVHGQRLAHGHCAEQLAYPGASRPLTSPSTCSSPRTRARIGPSAPAAP